MSDPLKIHGRIIDAGLTEISVAGERGRFTVHGINPDGSVNCYGGTIGRERYRAFRLDRIKTVHTKPKNRKNPKHQ